VTEPEDKARRPRRIIIEVLAIVVIALFISFVLKTFVVQTFYVPTSSMAATLEPNDRVLVPRWTGTASSLKRGDVVVFLDPGGWLPDSSATPTDPVSATLSFLGLLPPPGNHLIKRIIGLPGDTVACCSADGRLTVNGTPLKEPYVTAPATAVDADEYSYSVVVPPGMLWVLGDNRYDSADSAYHYSLHDGHQFVPETDVVGVATVISWPITRWQLINSYPDLFATVGRKVKTVIPQG
jgi:signal peptidase I